MKRRQVLKAVGATVTAGLTGLAGCSGPNPNSSGGADTTSPDKQMTTGSGASKESTKIVQMVTKGSEYYFDPIGLFIETGETITWKIQSDSHSSTAYKKGNGVASVTRIPDDAKAWDSGILNEQGATFKHTFETRGTYDYFCTPHKNLEMIGRIVVGEPGGPADGSMPSDGTVPKSQTIVDQGTVTYSDFSE